MFFTDGKFCWLHPHILFSASPYPDSIFIFCFHSALLRISKGTALILHSSAKEMKRFWSCLSFGVEYRSVNFGPNACYYQDHLLMDMTHSLVANFCRRLRFWVCSLALPTKRKPHLQKKLLVQSIKSPKIGPGTAILVIQVVEDL